MAKFIRTKYEADNGRIHPCRVSPDTKSLQVDDPDGLTVNDSTYAKVTGSNREFGLRCRRWVLNRSIAAGTAYDKELYARVPCLIANDFQDTSRQKGSVVTYKGASWTIIGHENEKIR